MKNTFPKVVRGRDGAYEAGQQLSHRHVCVVLRTKTGDEKGHEESGAQNKPLEELPAQV